MSQPMPRPEQSLANRQMGGYGSTQGVLGVRLVAYIVDIFIVGLIGLVVTMSVAFLGVVTFGIGWMLFPVVGICTAMAYAAITIGGVHQATIGMRVSGLKVERVDGSPPDGITAAAHCLLFYVATMTMGLLALTIIIGMLRSDSRMGHDILTGLVVVRN